jgi:hypothetical protein
MSIIGVVNMVVERTVFSNTNGTAPSAGVDVEPYLPTFEVANVSFIDCQASNNSGPGFAFYISHFKNTTAPFSMLLSNYTIASGHNFGISIDYIAPGVRGSMMVVNSSVRNTRFSPLAIIDKAAPDSSVTIRGCSFEANSPVTNPEKVWTSPISFIADQGCHSSLGWRATGGVTFEDVIVHDTRNRPWLYSEVEPGLGLINVTGTGLTVSNPNGCTQSGPLKLAAKCVTAAPVAQDQITRLKTTDVPATGSLRWLTFYNAMSNGARDTHSNLVTNEHIGMLVDWHQASGVRGLLDVHRPGNVTHAKLFTRPSSFNFSRPGLQGGGLRADWQRDLSWTLDTAMPHLKSGIISGIFLGDEPCCSGSASAENLSSVAAFAKTKLAGTGAFVYVNECSRVVNPAFRYAGSWRTVPAGLDVVSMDGYCLGSESDPQCPPADESQMVRGMYEKWLIPKMSAQQRLGVVPGLFGNYSQLVAAQDAALTAKLKGYLAWAREEPKIVLMNPWHYSDLGAPPNQKRAPNQHGQRLGEYVLGAYAFPQLMTFVRKIGDKINASRSAWPVKTDDGNGPWSGPAAQFDKTHDGLPILVVDGKAQPPLWLTLHTYASTDKGQGLLDNFDDQIHRAAAEGLNVVCICLTSDVFDFGSHGTAWLSDAQPLGNWSRKIFDKVIEINPKATFIIRFYSQQPDLPDIVMLNMTDGNRTDIGNTSGRSPYDPGVMNSLTLKWVASASSRMATMLRYLDKTYPRRVVGVFPCFLHTSEWFMPGPGDLSTHVHLSDYSEATEKRFCSETDPENASCKLPLPSQRVKPVLGSAFADVQTTKLNQYFSDCIVDAIEALHRTAKQLSGGNVITMAFYGYLYELAGTRLAGSGHLALHKLLESPHTDGIVSPYTYLNLARNNSLGPLMAHGPWDAAPLHGKLWITEDDSHLVLVSDCNKSISGRAPDTLCCCTTPQRRSRANQSADLMRRNIFTSLMHGNAMYLYDLGAAGWFGRADMKPESDVIWGGISRALSAIYGSGSDTRQQLSLSDGDGDTLDSSPLLQPEIAVFVSDVSETTRTINGDNMGTLLQEMLHIPPSIIASVGAPARMFVLSDLLTPGVDWSMFKFCIFLNAFVIPQNLSSAIDTKLRTGNTTLLWTYAAGVFATATDPRDALNVSRVSEMVGMPLTRGPGGRQLQIHVPASASLQAGFPRDYGASAAAQPNLIDPWFYLDNETAAASTGYEVLGHYKQQPTPHAATTTTTTASPQQCPPVHLRVDCPGPPGGRAGCLARGCCYNDSGPGPWCSHYNQQGEVALVRRVHSDHTVVFSGSPGLPVQLWTALAKSAGVHMYVDNRHCDLTPASWQVADVVEAHGNQLMVHASAACSGDQRLPRVVTLPHVAACVRDETNATVCSACRTFATAPMFAGEVQLYTIINTRAS